MTTIKILKKGLSTSIQDLGRTGYQKYGVPVSGVMDEYSHKVANILVGNALNEATLEATMLGPKIQFAGQQVIAITGGDLQPKLNNEAIQMWKKLTVEKGDILSFSGIKSGLRAYIAFAGGIRIDKSMGSKSYYSRADLGTKIEDMQELDIKPYEKNVNTTLDKKYIPNFEKQINCRVVLGPQEDYFTDEGIQNFFSSEYQVTNASDRMGYRLSGKAIEHKKTPDIISDGLSKGAIQIPGNGQPIVMMSDAQTTGGYSKIGYVIKADLNKLAQLKPGNTLRFTKISIEKAQKEYSDYIKVFDDIRNQLVVNRSINYYAVTVNGNQYNVTVEEI